MWVTYICSYRALLATLYRSALLSASLANFYCSAKQKYWRYRYTDTGRFYLVVMTAKPASVV